MITAVNGNRVPKLFLLLVALLAVGGLSGCIVHNRPLETDLAPAVRVPDRMAVMFFIDGVGNQALDERLAAGDLPNIRRHVLDRGLRYRRTVTGMPSITYAATATLLTGQDPGRHQVVGNRWFDPYSLRYQAYGFIKTYRTAQRDFIAPTIFELLHQQFTVSIQVATRRGVTREIDNWATSGINWFFGQFENVDKLTAMRFELIAEMANQTGHWPRFILAYFPACDEVAHRAGIQSPRYPEAIRHVDQQIGRICEGLQRAGVYDRTLLVLVTDHGQAPMRDGDGQIDVARHLAKHFGMRVTDRRLDSDAYMDRVEFYDRYDVVAVADAPRLLGLHLRQAGAAWYDRPQDIRPMQLSTRNGRITTEQLAEHLAGQPYSRFVAVRAGPNAVLLVGRTGKAIVEAAGRQRTYRVLQGQDPLVLGLDSAATTLPADEWLARTIDTDNPGVVSQIVGYFDSTRTGDVVVFAEPGYGFGPDRSGHGSTTRMEMRVPLVFAGPDVTPGATDRPARIHDVMPTIVTALGFADRLVEAQPLDGQVLPLQPQPATTSEPVLMRSTE